MQSLPLANFIQATTNSQLQKKPGGSKIVWNPPEEQDMRRIAQEIMEGSFSQSQALKRFKQERSANRTIGALRANKTPTAFRNKLTELLQEMRREV